MGEEFRRSELWHYPLIGWSKSSTGLQIEVLLWLYGNLSVTAHDETADELAWSTTNVQ